MNFPGSAEQIAGEALDSAGIHAEDVDAIASLASELIDMRLAAMKTAAKEAMLKMLEEGRAERIQRIQRTYFQQFG